MNTQFDVIIIGAGVTGAAIARELSRFKLKTALVEKEVDVSFGTSKANSGIIHAGFHSSSSTVKGALELAGNRMFDRLKEELDFPFERRGELMVAFTEEEIRILQTFYLQGKDNDVPYLELVGRERLLEMEPHLNPDIIGALFAPNAGIICPYEYCYSLVENAMQNGVELFTASRVIWLGRKTRRDRIEVATQNGLTLSGKFVINAAGLFADEIAALAGITDFKIHPRKGEEYLLDKRVGSLVKRVIFPVPTKNSKGMLVIPTVDGPVMVGPTAVEVEDKNDLSTTRDGLKTVFAHAQQMVPSIRSSDVITAFVGIRPAATGEDFIIGTTPMHGFINVAGIQSPGLTASPAIAEMVRDILLKEGLRMEADPSFDPVRRSVKRVRELIDKRKYEELGKIIEADKDYSKLVCRCENVTEAEVVASVRKGHVTLDAIKFTTRACCGRCQAGFCTSRIMDIIHRETGIPYEQISKKGPGTELIPIPVKKGEQSD
ncbi:NAD(P)/FAD-dependent oxidoreductase [Candidatus Omnitrophota bacterium]